MCTYSGKNKEAEMKTIQVLILALAIVGLGACSRSDPAKNNPDSLALVDDQNTLTDEEKNFIDYASEMHTGEIAMAQQAKEKSTNDSVKQHADAVIKTHSDALKALSERIGRSARISKTASADTQNHMQFLAPLSGAKYDKEFVDLMVADHQSAADTFKMESEDAQNPNLQKYVKSTIAGLGDRLDEARNLQRKLASKPASGN
jgi:putative membrane protein